LAWHLEQTHFVRCFMNLRLKPLTLHAWGLAAAVAGVCAVAPRSVATAAETTDYAEAQHVGDWLRHPVYGDPSFDAFERLPGNPIHRGAPPFEWPVNGFLFVDDPSGQWYVFVGDYGKGYLTPPSRCLLYCSTDRGLSWTNLGVVLHGDPQMFDRGGHTPDVSVVHVEGRYHMVYDWGEPDFNAEGGLAYAWAERPEGPWHRALQPLTRNSTLPKLSGRYQRTYAATLLRRKNDWLVLAMMDHAPHSWALFAMTATKPEGPYSERRLARQVEQDYFHPPLLEFFPAFEHGGFVYAPATSVALNRDFNALFRAPIELAEDSSAWSLFQCGSVWHSDDREAEHFGIWGQTFSGFVDAQGTLQVMFPSRDAEGRGTINLARRPWKEPFRKRGFVLSGHQGPAFTLLKEAYDDFTLEADLELRGTLRLLLDYAAPLEPNTPSSDATLHPLMNTRHLALEFAPEQWRLLWQEVSEQTETLASGKLEGRRRRTLRIERRDNRLVVNLDRRELWAGSLPIGGRAAKTGVLGLGLEPNSHLVVERFQIEGTPKPARTSFLWTEALLGAGESLADWTETSDAGFRFGSGAVSKAPSARVKWNIVGCGLQLWSPRGPGFGSAEVRVDGKVAATLDLHADEQARSQPVWSVEGLPAVPHAVVLVAKSGLFPVDCLEVTTGGAPAAASSPTQQSAELRGPRIMVRAEAREGRLQEHYSALRDGAWIEVAATEQAGRTGPVSLVPARNQPFPGIVQNLSLSGDTLVEEFAVGPHRITRKLAVVGDGPWIRAATRLEPSSKLMLRQFSERFRFLHRPDWSYSPSVGGFNPDAQYKAPLILVQADRVALGVVPDVTTLNREDLNRCNHALDLDVPAGPMLGVGFMPARLALHSVYALDSNRVWVAEAPIESAYYLLVTASAEPFQAYREAVRFHWERFGRIEQAHAADQQVGTDSKYRSLALWDDWRDRVWKQESPRMWLSVPLPDGSTGGGVRTKRWGPGPSVYLSSWFNSLRTSYGTALYARRTSQDDLLKLAGQTLTLALQAPRHDGAFKCIAVPGTNGGATVWAAGDGSGGSTSGGFLGYDMCWTGYWLLRWRAAGLPGSDSVLPRCRKLATFLMARQLANGMLPTRFAEDGSVQEEPSKAVQAETGPVALFLLELYHQDHDPEVLAAAKKGLAFLEKEVIPQRQWYDYETFWSCSPRTARFDERTRQWPANNLALSQSVAAYLLAHQVTGEARYLALGESLLDYLLLFQQCWTNPRLENLSGSAMLLGGFTTQNSDAEWSDARQSQCGNILLDYYRATGKVEYLERGIAALRAQFPISPSENWAHVGYGPKAGVSSFHWGTGSGMAGIEIEEDCLRDGIVDVAAGRAVGVNGLNLTDCRVDAGRIEFRFSSPFQWKRPPVVVFRRTEPSRLYRVLVNGVEAGSWRGEDLAKGVPLLIRPNDAK
jgi:hypothetical protein